jgi:ElaB/YqjD/DUF883 family membrane-anchored ribosome-binding protein
METTTDKMRGGMPPRKASESNRKASEMTAASQPPAPQQQSKPLAPPVSGAGDRAPSTGTAGTVLGPDGEAAHLEKDVQGALETARNAGREIRENAQETWSDFASRLDRFVLENPRAASLTSLGIGLVVGAMVGAIIAKD